MTSRAGAECPIGCGRKVGSGKLLCRPCWSEVPGHLQRDVNRTWRAWRRDVGSGDALRAYRVARDAAIASVA